MYNCRPYCYAQQNERTANRFTSADKTVSALPEITVPAMAYVPYQESNEVYSFEKALEAGTVFPVLDKPFLKGCCR